MIKTIQNIQTLRFVAAFWIVLYHMQPPTTAFSAGLLPKNILGMGFAGVDLFFVISGVIMAETTRHLVPGGRTARQFIYQRFSRIFSGWLPYFVVYLIGFQLLLGIDPNVRLLSSFFLLPQHVNQYLLPITWTLSFELYFYVFLGVILIWTRIRAAWVVAGVSMILLTCILCFVYLGYYGLRNASNATLLHKFYAYPQVLEFGAGFLLSEWVLKPAGNLRVWPWAAGALVLGLGAYWYQYRMNLYGSGMAGYYYSPERTFLLGGMACCVVAIAIILERREITPFRLLQQLGSASYSMYLGHIGIVLLASAAYVRMDLSSVHFPDSVFGLATLTMCTIFGWLSYKWIEKPLNMKFRSLGRDYFSHN